MEVTPAPAPRRPFDRRRRLKRPRPPTQLVDEENHNGAQFLLHHQQQQQQWQQPPRLFSLRAGASRQLRQRSGELKEEEGEEDAEAGVDGRGARAPDRETSSSSSSSRSERTKTCTIRRKNGRRRSKATAPSGTVAAAAAAAATAIALALVGAGAVVVAAAASPPLSKHPQQHQFRSATTATAALSSRLCSPAEDSRAYVTTIADNGSGGGSESVDRLLGARMLAQSLRSAGSKGDVVVLVPLDKATTATVDSLRRDGLKVHIVPRGPQAGEFLFFFILRGTSCSAVLLLHRTRILCTSVKYSSR